MLNCESAMLSDAKTMPGVTGTLLSNPAGLDQNWKLRNRWKNSVVDGSMIEPKCMAF